MKKSQLDELKFKDGIVEFMGFMFLGHIQEVSELQTEETSGLKYIDITFRQVMPDFELEGENGKIN